MDAGDHVIVVGEVADCGTDLAGAPLVFYRGSYGTVAM
jgi:flavin reductase (DIM6/NTAB) family NADH-FMN oxidoreductase RutF